MPHKPCVFCQIVRGELSCQRIFEDDDFLAFLDHSPRYPGHSLLIPKVHVQTILDLPPDLSAPLVARTQRLSRAVEKALDAGGFFVAINNRLGQSVPHLHVHVIPRRKGDRFSHLFWPRHRYTGDEEAQVRDAIVAALDGETRA